ncbi:MAG: TAXI family TRAP transporter solute-binding subunit, partial [Candidatus Electrothrix sp. ATG2]|nr:TAXI family TRAP transporter solute-binding subunit [Candidatus Electrothrix sp. ATG2]
MGIVTGGTKGTYIQIGYDISRLVKQEGIYLKVHPSNGSLDNVADVYERKDVQLGIVQSDVLASIGSSGDTQLNKVAKQIKMLFPLYNEEVHILASRSITSFSDLEGKIVAIGSEGSGTALTASLLFEIAGVTPSEKKNIGSKKALMLLRSEVIDAMFYISGYPVSLFSGIYTDKLHLL